MKSDAGLEHPCAESNFNNYVAYIAFCDIIYLMTMKGVNNNEGKEEVRHYLARTCDNPQPLWVLL